MKKLFSLILALCLVAALSGCGAAPLSPPAAEPELPVPPVEALETITYTVITEPYEQTVTAEDGTKLMHISFHLPHLQALVNGIPIETPATPAQEAAMERVTAFNGNFEQWREAETIEENIASAKAHYEIDPAWFGTDGALTYAEELDCTVFRIGSLISVAASYYSYLGGAHPNTVFFSWNFDLDSGTFLNIPELATDPQAFTLAVADMIETQATAYFRDPANGYGDLTIDDIYWSDYRTTMEKWGSDYASFDSDGLSIIFSAYELAPYAAGPQEFHFPYSALDNYWSDSGRALLGLD